MVAALDAPARCIRLTATTATAHTQRRHPGGARSACSSSTTTSSRRPTSCRRFSNGTERSLRRGLGDGLARGRRSQDAPAGVATSRRAQIGVPSHCCVLDRDRFLALGGFDLLFSPAMWEEMDLGARVWRSRADRHRSGRVFQYTRATSYGGFSPTWSTSGSTIATGCFSSGNTCRAAAAPAPAAAPAARLRQ